MHFTTECTLYSKHNHSGHTLATDRSPHEEEIRYQAGRFGRVVRLGRAVRFGRAAVRRRFIWMMSKNRLHNYGLLVRY